MTLSQEKMLELLDVNLPKWPQMLVWGESVTVEQAKDIILRTDGFLADLSEYAGGNNHAWNKWARDVLGLERVRAATIVDGKQDWRLYSTVEQRFHELLGALRPEYVSNNWASCCFIYGPHGWVSPSGKIGYIDNVGKWPSVEDVLKDWQMLAKAFPYLDLTATLMSGESCEADGDDEGAEATRPLVSIRVVHGTAELLASPVLPEVQPERRDISSALGGLMRSGREQGLPEEWIVEFGARTYPLLEMALAEGLKEREEENKTQGETA